MHFLDVKNGQLVLSETMSPTPNSNQCLVAVKAIGVNRADILQREGKYPPPKGESPILGLEVAGEIIETPPNDLGIKKGDRVCGLVAGGGYAEQVVINVEHLIKLPDAISYQQGAAIAEVFLTAYQSLFTIANLAPKSNVLIHAGASGVGTAAIQLAKANDCFVVTTVGSEEKRDACKALGADVVLNYRSESFVEWTKENLAQGFDVILDVVAGEYFNQNIKVSALDGHLVILAILGGRFAESIDVARMLQKRMTITASTLRNRSDGYKAKLVADFSAKFMAMFSTGELTPVIDTVFNWQEAELAHQYMADNKNIGKLILTVN